MVYNAFGIPEFMDVMTRVSLYWIIAWFEAHRHYLRGCYIFEYSELLLVC